MRRIIRYPFSIVTCLILIAAAALPARASFHVFGVNEVYSNPSGSIQFIELHDRFGSDFEGFFNGVTIVSGANTYTFPSDLPNQQTANKFVLLGTAGYAALPGVPAPNFTIPANFFNPAGDTLNYGFGADIISFGPVPASASQSLNRSGADMLAGPTSPTNFAGDTGSVPEPATLSLLAGLGIATCLRRRPTRR